MKKVFISSLVLVAFLVGCKSSGGICCEGPFEELEEMGQEVYLTPVAVLDNRTVEDRYFFSCENSYDRDENNQSIMRCDWNITAYGDGISSLLLEKNATNEVNVTRFFDTMTEFIIVELKVTDNEGQKNTITKRFDMEPY